MARDDPRLEGDRVPGAATATDPLEAGPIRVCYVGADGTDGETARELERRGDRLSVTIETADGATAAVAAGGVDCLICAGSGTDALSLLERVRDRDRGRHPPVVVYTDADASVVRELLAVDGTDCVRRSTSGSLDILAARARNAAVRYRARTTADELEARRAVSERLVSRVARSAADPGPTAVDHDEDGVAATIRETLLEYDHVSRLEIGIADADGLEVMTATATGAGAGAEGAEASVLAACRDADSEVLAEAIRTGEAVTITGEDGRRVPADEGEKNGEADASSGIVLEAGDRLTVQSVAVGERHHVLVAAVTTARRGTDVPFLSGIGSEIAHAIYATHLKADRRRFRNAVEHAGHVVLITDDEGRIEYANPAFESVTGYDREEAIGRTPAMLQSGEHDESFYEGLWETIRAGEVWRGEVINERKGGERYVIDQTVAPIEDDHGETVGFVGINQNITDRKRRERDLAVLKRAVDQVGIGIGAYGTDGTFGYVNERFAELAGATPDELRSRHLAEVNAAFDRDRFDRYWASFADGETRIRESTFRRLDTGEEIPVEVVTSRIRIDDVPYQVGTVRDITDRKRRERDLRRFRSAVEHAGHGVLITDREGTIEYVNDAFEEMSGYAASAVIGETPAILKSGEHDASFYEELWETILAGEVWRGEIVNERSDGTQYVVDQTIAPITEDGRDEPVGFVAINQDITALKAHERELEQQNDRLSEYGRMVAHDLRNPLTLFEAHLEELRSHLEVDPDALEATVPELRAEIESLEETVEYMRRLIEDLLSMAEQGQVVLEAEPTSLASVARAAWQEIDDETAALEVADGRVAADPDRLRELLSNLFRNAVEHGSGSTSSRPNADDAVEEGATNSRQRATDPSVTVRVGPLDFVDGFFVADDGPGIPADDRDRVLERGYTTAEEGTGFGLAVVSQIADAHGWEVVVTESEAGGARFEFYVHDEP